jgi:hypothetical protein
MLSIIRNTQAWHFNLLKIYFNININDRQRQLVTRFYTSIRLRYHFFHLKVKEELTMSTIIHLLKSTISHYDIRNIENIISNTNTVSKLVSTARCSSGGSSIKI